MRVSRTTLRTVVDVEGQLGLEGMPRKLVRVTPAKLATWSDCPRRYRMAYLDRPTPARGGAWAHNTLGAVVHNALRAFFELPPTRRTVEVASDLVRRYWKSDGFRDADQAAEHRERARGWVAAYVDGLDPTVDPVGLERWVSTPTSRIVAEGRVDRIDARDGELVIVDYKTGRHVLTADDARGSQALALYAVAARRTLRRPCRRVELHHLPSGQVLTWEHTEESLARHVRRAEEAADDLQLAADTLAAGGDPDVLFPPRPGRQCSWCDFRRHCAEGQRAAPDLDPWALLAP
ncbi:PD-(D/E)XK nuclease superfamily protein [Streptoalloteichus tenebrarius]|uniref:PD-(D/E)XK nuclease superfamily protein n=1 Tax=Streptoalloteichus tenebrarius (strain ATCC 17920 / DSM 40477 / JCM 4838 / CBS 697.72 / NBRC 16177 / NCIMB 11028 / NRRL B-12390 / A12253. 1 / ISP 5477) TaxID=1933 RepID=A0ABT1HVN2_STRSD|nr:PD-(D/E)XK nuclease superfamily protein [Streptoalloteichus tenebrarius]